MPGRKKVKVKKAFDKGQYEAFEEMFFILKSMNIKIDRKKTFKAVQNVLGTKFIVILKGNIKYDDDGFPDFSTSTIKSFVVKIAKGGKRTEVLNIETEGGATSIFDFDAKRIIDIVKDKSTNLGPFSLDAMGGEKNDVFKGSSKSDTFSGGKGKDKATGGAGKDMLDGEEGNDALKGGKHNDTIHGGKGKDKIEGNQGKDKLFGEEGDDTLEGGPGDDTLTGGPGSDTFVFAPKDGSDTITDFEDGKDKLDLTKFKFKNKAEALSHFSEYGGADDGMVKFSYKGTTITINGADLGDIGNADIDI